AGSIVLDGAAGSLSNSASTLTVSSGTLLNTGSITVNLVSYQNGGRTISAAINNQGTITANTALTINGAVTNLGSVDANAPLTINGAVTNGDASHAGTLNPGGVNAAGCMTINGPLTQGAGGVLNIDVGGNSGCS